MYSFLLPLIISVLISFHAVFLVLFHQLYTKFTSGVKIRFLRFLRSIYLFKREKV